jgi:hypothetical protein
MDVYLITIELPVAEPPVALPDPSTDDPGDVPARCEWLFDPDSSLQAAIAYDLTGESLQCDQLAVWTAVLPPDPDGDLTVLLCDAHRAEAQAEGITDVQPLFAS